MLDHEFYSVVEDAAGRVRGQLHRLRGDGSWSPPLPEGVEPPAELASRSTLGAAGLLTRSALPLTGQVNELQREILRVARSCQKRRARREGEACGVATPISQRRRDCPLPRWRDSDAGRIRHGDRPAPTAEAAPCRRSFSVHPAAAAVLAARKCRIRKVEAPLIWP
jgi:hypothetical protein